MPYRVLFIVPLMALAAACSRPSDPQTTASPYAGEEARAIKALSAQEIEAYLSGEGMGLARAAELNHYPGPKHVLALAGELDLDDRQRDQTRRFFAAMEADAVALGRKIVDKEQALDRLFAEEKAAERDVRALLHEISELQAELRLVHLKAHLKMKDLLTDEQVERYDQLRGYDADAPPGQQHQHEGMEH